jgi:quercetin dioxygenase-like cupin family protein
MEGRAHELELVPALAGSALALLSIRLQDGSLPLHGAEHDSLLYVFAGAGEIVVGGERAELREATAALLLAGEDATVTAERGGLAFLLARLGIATDLHAPLGPREIVCRDNEAGDVSQATGARSFRVLFGPHNGSTRATLFVGSVPPGRAPWHYHLYDEIVWVQDGAGRVLRRGSSEEIAAGSAFRLRPHEVHIVENSSRDRDLTLIGIFTPAGSPSAAYLAPAR